MAVPIVYITYSKTIKIRFSAIVYDKIYPCVDQRDFHLIVSMKLGDGDIDS